MVVQTTQNSPPIPMPNERVLRLALLLITLASMFGVAAELWLLDHHEEWRQWIPLAVMGAAGLSIAVFGVTGSPWALRAWQVSMLGLILAGGLGTWFHMTSKIEFQKEMAPEAGPAELLWSALQSQSPPSLAPGMLAQLGFMGLFYTYAHPVLRRKSTAAVDAPAGVGV